jgi:hypothetical protein
MIMIRCRHMVETNIIVTSSPTVGTGYKVPRAGGTSNGVGRRYILPKLAAVTFI